MASSPVVLILHPNNPCNTSLLDADGKVLYTVNTEHGQHSKTYIRNGDEEVLAWSQWRDVLPDKVSIGTRPPTSVNDWLRKSIVPFVDEVTFKDDRGKKYKWKGWSAGSSLELFTAEDGYKQPIARFIKPRKDYSTTPPMIVTSAQLMLDSRAVVIRDTVVISFLFLEKTRRIRETSTQNKADVLGTQRINFLTSDYVIRNGGL
ncbi:hypothetical protein OBBRIDRAFT_784114 [Obba rivulosa]|uniref:DUF6593 domain-containing protein n=1 Tax=Obba rivulosa TaxID=1052685 RepID=A0A8E2AK06_9APHY|nr:hypothetical protein OBBRIDRAFT_784114 [Obba rivulosa]